MRGLEPGDHVPAEGVGESAEYRCRPPASDGAQEPIGQDGCQDRVEPQANRQAARGAQHDPQRDEERVEGLVERIGDDGVTEKDARVPQGPVVGVPNAVDGVGQEGVELVERVGNQPVLQGLGRAGAPGQVVVGQVDG